MRFAAPVLAVALALLGSGALVDGCYPSPEESAVAREPVLAKETVVVNCGACHTLAAAGASGRIGPNLDRHVPDVTVVEALIRHGRGTMPPFGDLLSDGEIRALAAYVVRASASPVTASRR